MEWNRTTAVVADRRLAYRRAGSGTPLLYLHDAGADTLDSPAFDDLATDHDVVLVDLPGYGGSGPPAGIATAADVAALLAGLLDHLDWATATVAGTSLGGWFALELAVHAPARVRALLLCDAAGLHTPQDYLFALFAQGRAAASAQQLIADALAARLPRTDGDPERLPPDVAAVVYSPWVQELAAAAACSWHPYTQNPRVLGLLSRVRCPTTVLWGRHDALIPLRHGRLLAAGIPGARFEVVAAGHLVALDLPEAFSAAVRSLTAAGTAARTS